MANIEFTGLQLSADDVRQLTGWGDAMVEDYISVVDALNNIQTGGATNEEALKALQDLVNKHLNNIDNPHATSVVNLIDTLINEGTLGNDHILIQENGRWINRNINDALEKCCKDLIIISAQGYDRILSGKELFTLGLRTHVGDLNTDNVGLSFENLPQEGYSTTITSDGVSQSVGSNSFGNPYWNENGTKLWIRASGTSSQLAFNELTFATPFDLSSFVSTTTITLPVQVNSGSNLGIFWISKDGLTLISQSYTRFFQFDMTTAFDLSTAVYTKQAEVGTLFNPRAYNVSPSNSHAYGWSWGTSNSRIYQYNISNDNDVDSVSFNASFFDYGTIYPAVDASPRGLAISADGLKFFTLLDDNFNTRHMITTSLTSPDNISAMTLVDDLTGVFQYNISGGQMTWSQDGLKVFETIGGSIDTMYQYSSTVTGGGLTAKLYHDDVERVKTTSEGIIVTGKAVIEGVGAELVLPKWATGSEPTSEYEGGLVYNNSLKRLTYRDNTKWNPVATKEEYDAHVAGTADQHPASDVTFDDTVFGHGLTDTQSAVDYLHGELQLREVNTTGLYSGGNPMVINALDPTHSIDVPAGVGGIIDGYTDRDHPTGYRIDWTAVTLDLTTYFTDPVGVVTIYVTPNLADPANSTVNVIQGIAPTTLYRTNIILGHVFYHASVIDQVMNSPIQVGEVGLTLYDFIEYNTPEENTRGVNIRDVSGTMSIWCESGTLFHIGGNVDAGDPHNPNILSFPALGDASTLEPFEIHLADGSQYATGQTVMPELYESPLGTVNTLTGNKATIHYMYRSASGELILQLGQNEYANGRVARDSLQVDNNSYVRFTGSGSTLFRAQIYLQNTATDFSNSAFAGIVNAGGGGSGGGGTVAVSNFINLTDVLLGSYAGYANYTLTVNGTETGVVAVDMSTIYEPIFAKNTAFNKDFGTIAGTVAEGNHTHSGVYEPADPTILKDADIGITVEAYVIKNTAWNVDFGTTAGTVAEGNHLHAGVYEPAFAKNTAFNKNFGTTAGTVLEGDTVIPSDFTDLGDTPAAYTGHGGKVVKVNVGETGLEFSAGGGAGIWRGTSPPTDKTTYPQWLDTNTGFEYTWYQDGTSDQWVQTQATDPLISGAVVPVGSIVMYSGAFADIPANWALCDGTSGTPNLTDKFVYGTNTELEIGDTGGDADSQLIQHNHTASFSGNAMGNHSHNDTFYINSVTNHTHSAPNGGYAGGSSAAGGDITSNRWTYGSTGSTGFAGGHSHSLSGAVSSASAGTPSGTVTVNNEGSDSGTGANIPPYVKLAYIMRIS